MLMVGLVVHASTTDYNVRDFGAKGDGKTLDHHAINAAIDSCVAHGGGRVVVPAGTYLCGSIRMKSHVELHLSAGAKILAAPAKMKAYDEAESWEGPAYKDGGHTYFKNSLIYAIGQEHVSITGRGMIDGLGLTKKDTEKGGVVNGGNIGTGDKAIAFKLCRNILIRDVTIYRGGHFGIIVTGMPGEPLRNITLSNIQLQFRGGGRAELAKREYREQGKNYPEAKFAKETPAYGLFARHVDGLEVNNVTFRTMKLEYRPAAMLVDVKNESITNLKADLQKGAKLIVKKK